jgi:hypothetical protein
MYIYTPVKKFKLGDERENKCNINSYVTFLQLLKISKLNPIHVQHIPQFIEGMTA